MLSRRLALTIIWVMTLALPAMTDAQPDTLSPEEAALLDEFLVAFAVFGEMETVQIAFEETDEVISDITYGDQAFLTTERYSHSYVGRYKLTAPTGLLMSGTLTADRNDNDVIIQYTLDYELRYIDGVAYINAEYTDATDNAPELPTGWQVLDLDNIPGALVPLELEFLIQDNLFPEERAAIFERVAAQLQAGTTAAAEREEMLADGTTLRVIRLELGGADFIDTVIAQGQFDADDPFRAQLADYYRQTPNIFSYEIGLDEAGNPITFGLGTNIAMVNQDYNALDENAPPNSTYDFSIQGQTFERYQAVDKAFPPIDVPSIGGAGRN
jgi:hypothetical protein